jgi:amino acid permease
MIGSFIHIVFYSDEYKNFDKFQDEVWGLSSVKFPIMYGICLILIPLCLIKDISKMRMAGLFSICSLLYCIMVIIIECPWYYDAFTKKESEETQSKINWFDISTGFDKQLYFFRGTATIFFAFSCQVGAFPVYKNLKNNISRRINKVFTRSIMFDLALYIVVGICGFLTAPINTPDLIIKRNKLLDNDLAMDLARLGIAVSLILSAPANFIAFRLSFFETIWGTNEIDNKR